MIATSQLPGRLFFALACLTALSSLAAVAFAAKGDCGQPSSAGAGPKTSDALTILKESVGQVTDCDPKPCICDVNTNGSVTASDALLVLKAAVGQPVTPECSCVAPAWIDDFNDNSADPTSWGQDYLEGDGKLREIDHELQYTCAEGTLGDQALRPWIRGDLPFDDDWAVQIDLENTTVSTSSAQGNSFGLSVVDLGNSSDELYAELFVEAGEGRLFYSEIQENADYVGNAFTEDLGLTTGALRIQYKAATRGMTVLYDVDPTDGYQWVAFGSFGVAGSGGADGDAQWGMSAGDRFGVSVYGWSTLMTVKSGEMSGDNFRVEGSATP